MLKIITVASVAALALAIAVAPQPAQARDGAIAAGVIGGLAVGAIVGSQVNRDNGYRGDGYYRNSAYAGRECYIERQDFEDRYGRLHVRNVRVCN
jgi:uncharacterized membrane protein